MRSKVETKVGGSSPLELAELFVVIDELDAVVGEWDPNDPHFFSEMDDLNRPTGRDEPTTCDSENVKNRSAGTLAPSRKGSGLLESARYPQSSVLPVDEEWISVISWLLLAVDEIGWLRRWILVVLASITSRSVSDMEES